MVDTYRYDKEKEERGRVRERVVDTYRYDKERQERGRVRERKIHIDMTRRKKKEEELESVVDTYRQI